MRPVLLQKLKVRVGEIDHSQQLWRNQNNEEVEITQHSEQLPVNWHEGSVEIIPYEIKSEAEKELLKKYSYTEKKEFGRVIIDAQLINQENYKKKMHSFLYQEEMEQTQRVRRWILSYVVCRHAQIQREF